MSDHTPDVAVALQIARNLACVGVPIFIARPDLDETGQWNPTGGTGHCGYWLPRGWQQTTADPGAVDQWHPGMALCAVMGCGLDLLDCDPRNGGDPAALNGATPVSYAAAATPSGGIHSFVKTLGVRSRDNLTPGIDIKAGDAEGKGRGFAFIAPTVKMSKTTSLPAQYQWINAPDVDRLAGDGMSLDDSGHALAELVRLAHQGSKPDTHHDADTDVRDFMRVGPWVNVAATLAAGRNAGVHKLASALRGQGGWSLEDALAVMDHEVWPVIDQSQGGHEFAREEYETVIANVWRQYPDGADQRAQENAHGHGGGAQAPDGTLVTPRAYFNKNGGLLAATLAADVLAMGPLAEGVDDRLWRYTEGVWRPNKHIARDRCAFLLGERFRDSHARTAESMVRAQVPTIACQPVPEYINFRNGLLAWRTGQLHAHAPEVLSTVQMAVDYDETATCPEFDKYLAEVVESDVIEAVWELIGYLMFSGNPLHKAVMLTGTGRNGKGTLLRVLLALLDRRNVTTVSLHDLVNTRFTTASLFGKLANIAGDIDATYMENTATLKGITGGDTISAEHKGRDRFDFEPWAVPVFSANKVPASADTTVGYLSRWLIIPFPHDFTGREDRGLDDRLHAPEELRGVAAKAVAALPGLLARGDFQLTSSMQAAREEFAQRVDQVRTWVHDCCDLSPEHPFLPRTRLYQAYQMWAARDGHKPVRATEFYDRLEAIGAVPTAYAGTRGFRGIKIIDGGGYGLGGGTVYPSTAPSDGAGNGSGLVQEPAPTPAPSDPKRENAAETPAEGTQAAPTVHQDQQGSDLGKQCQEVDLGADGADTSHPPSRARTREKGWKNPAPSAPTPKSATSTKSTSQSSKDKKAAERLAKVAAAAGETVGLPAAVGRGGLPTGVPLTEARDLVAQAIERAGELTVDVEHTGYPIGHADYALKTVQLGDDEIAVVFDATDPEQAAAITELLAAAGKLHAHSATADLVPLDLAGLLDAETGWAKMHDTVIPAKLADPASTGNGAEGLKELAAAVLGEQATAPASDRARAQLFKAGRWLTEVKADTEPERSGWAQVDPSCSTMVTYAASDVLDTAALATRLPWPTPEQLDRERTVQAMTARVAHRGLRIDGDQVRALTEQHTSERARVAEKVRAFGIDNPGSAQQVGQKLASLGAELPRTKPSTKYPDGQPSAAAAALTPLTDAAGPIGELASAVLDYRHHDTVLGTFLEPYAQLAERGDGRARPTVYSLGTDTGRMSCVRPNLQQLPRSGGVRACITADPGQLLVSADFSGVELRVAAALSGDQNLIRMILDDDTDVHWLIARQVWGPNATKTHRYKAKRIVFGRIYGGGVTALAGQAGVDEPTAQAAIDTMDQLAPQLAAWSQSVRQAVKLGRTDFPTYANRIIHLSAEFPHKGPNFCIQGTARELLVDALLRWKNTPWGDTTILPVHDEILAAVPEDDADAATEALVSCMTSELFGVPILAEPSAPSFAWADST